MHKEEFYRIVSKDTFLEKIRKADLPAFFYAQSVIRKKHQDLIGCLPVGFEGHYAFKANPNREVVRFIRTLGMGADVASRGELQLAEEVGYPPERIELTGPGKTEEELALAIDLDIACINVESISEIRKIAAMSRCKGKKARIGIRVNPRRIAESGIKMGGDHQFGIIEDELDEAFKLIRLENGVLEFVGFHMHLGSQFLKAEKLLSHFRFVLEKSYEIAQRREIGVKKINFGGGWGIDVFGKTAPLDLMVIQNGLSQLFNESPFKEFCRGMKLVVEPGRFLVAECGVYAARILYRKQGYQREFLILDGGMHHLYGAAGGIGQIIRRNYEIDWVLSHNESAGKKRFHIVGSLCLPDDVLASDAELPCCLGEGDMILFLNSGAYGLTASPQKFLSHPLSQEFLIE